MRSMSLNALFGVLLPRPCASSTISRQNSTCPISWLLFQVQTNEAGLGLRTEWGRGGV
jgi:hypothetical protein